MGAVKAYLKSLFLTACTTTNAIIISSVPKRTSRELRRIDAIPLSCSLGRGFGSYSSSWRLEKKITRRSTCSSVSGFSMTWLLPKPLRSALSGLVSLWSHPYVCLSMLFVPLYLTSRKGIWPTSSFLIIILVSKYMAQEGAVYSGTAYYVHDSLWCPCCAETGNRHGALVNIQFFLSYRLDLGMKIMKIFKEQNQSSYETLTGTQLDQGATKFLFINHALCCMSLKTYRLFAAG